MADTVTPRVPATVRRATPGAGGARDEADAGAAGEELARILELEPAADPPGRHLDGGPRGADVFTGTSMRQPARRVFGGQILAQAVIAAGRTVDPPAVIHSLHGYFLLPGDPRVPIRFTVDRLRDGRSFFARRVDAHQDGQLIATVLSSFQLPAGGPGHQEQPPLLPPPDGLARHVPFSRAAGPEDGGLDAVPVELRPVPAGHHPAASPGHLAGATWMRVTVPLPDTPLLHGAMLAFLSDFSILWPALQAHSSDRTRVKTASIDHSLWFHRPCRVDEWIVYDIASPSAGSARASGTGRMFTAGGLLAATSAQEGVFRLVSRG